MYICVCVCMCVCVCVCVCLYTRKYFRKTGLGKKYLVFNIHYLVYALN